MGKPRFRYTLRTLFVVATVVCALLYHWHVAAQLKVAEAELRQLRTETGRITLEDRSKLHAIYVDTGEPNAWRWRLFHSERIPIRVERSVGSDPARSATSEGRHHEHIERAVLGSRQRSSGQREASINR